jgi:acyl carrier protein
VTCGPRLLQMVRDLDRRPPTGLDDTWRDLGVDSLDLLVLVTNVEDEFGVALLDATVAGAATVADLAAAVDRLRAGVSG